jgi:hypothetical protein
MPAKAKPRARKRHHAAATSTEPVRLIVRRGAEQRFAKLKEKTADLDVVVTWDRREKDRRSASEPVPADRRRQDRRQETPFTWDVADFAVVVSRDPEK